MANSLHKEIQEDSNLASTQTCDPIKMEERSGYKKTKLGWIPEEWELIKLGNIGEFKNGINKGKEDFGFGVPFINLMDVFGKPVLLQDRYDLVNATQPEIENYSLNKGDVLFIRSSVKPSGVGLTSVIKEDVPNTVYSGFLIRYRPHNENTFNIDYLQYCFHERGFRKRLIVRSSSSANTNINQDNLKQLFIYLPRLQEQQKIATILSTWDSAIAKQKQLIVAKQEFKKGLMQLLLTGKKRFEGFEGEWSEIKIGQYCTMYSGGTPSRAIKEYYGGNIPWIKSGELNQGLIVNVEESITELALKNSSTKEVEKGTLLLALYGATAGVVAITDVKGAINQAILAIETNAKLDKMFLFYLLKIKMPKYLKNLVQGGQPNLNGGMIKKLKIKSPLIEEQQKIASVLSTADKEIELLQSELVQLQGQKRGLMQVLLTGEKRVKTNG